MKPEDERVGRAPVVDSVLDLVGKTPLVRLSRVPAPGAARVWAKAEHLQPGGSVKDRISLSIVERAERDGTLRPGGTIVEATSGNMGVALAIVCAVKRYRLVLTMPESMSLERRALLEAYGAEVILTPAEGGMEAALEAARAIERERGAFMANQFENQANPDAHEQTTAPEILSALGRAPDVLVVGVGTGGTLTGVARALRASGARTRIIAVEPATSAVLSGKAAGPTKIQGLGAGIIPPVLERALIDEVRTVEDARAHSTRRELARGEGLLVGLSAGANVAVACDVAAELGEGRDVVTFLCDTGERYFSLETFFPDAAASAQTAPPPRGAS